MHLKSENDMGASGLVSRNDLVGTRRPFLYFMA